VCTLLESRWRSRRTESGSATERALEADSEAEGEAAVDWEAVEADWGGEAAGFEEKDMMLHQ